MSEQLATDEITLRVPASPDYVRVVRVGAAALALRQGMSFTEIDELRGAIDEALALLLKPPADDGTAIACRFLTGPASLDLEFLRTDGTAVQPWAAPRLKEILGPSAVTFTVNRRRGSLLLSLPRQDSDHNPHPAD